MEFQTIEHAEGFMSHSKNATATELLEAATYLNVERIKLNLQAMEELATKIRAIEEEHKEQMRVLEERNKEYGRQARLLTEMRAHVSYATWTQDAQFELQARRYEERKEQMRDTLEKLMQKRKQSDTKT